MIKIGDRVKIIKENSRFKGCIGVIDRQGNGTCWQVDLCCGFSIYYFASELEILK